MTLPEGAYRWASRAAGSARFDTYPSEMAQNFWTAIFAWTAASS